MTENDHITSALLAEVIRIILKIITVNTMCQNSKLS